MRGRAVAIVIGFALGALIASAPSLIRRALIRYRRQRLATTGLRPEVRVRVMIAPSVEPDWALLTVHISNRSSAIWWLHQIDVPAGKGIAVVASASPTRSRNGLAAVSTVEAIRTGALFPSRLIHPDDASRANFTGLADGTYEYVHLHCPEAHGPIVVEITLQRIGGKGRSVRLKAARSIAQERGPV